MIYIALEIPIDVRDAYREAERVVFLFGASLLRRSELLYLQN